MTKMNTWAMICVAAIFVTVGGVIAGCRLVAGEPAGAKTLESSKEWKEFVGAYDAITAAINATPKWNYKEANRRAVHALAKEALAKADALLPPARKEQISEAAVELAKNKIAQIAYLEAGFYAKQEQVPGGLTLNQFCAYREDECAYWELHKSLPLLEKYATDGIWNQWRYDSVLKGFIRCAERLEKADPAGLKYWDEANHAAREDVAKRSRRFLVNLTNMAKAAGANARGLAGNEPAEKPKPDPAAAP